MKEKGSWIQVQCTKKSIVHLHISNESSEKKNKKTIPFIIVPRYKFNKRNARHIYLHIW